MAIKAVATDIDATLTDSHRVLSLAAAQAMRLSESNGFPVILVSGNVLPVCHSLNVYLGLSGPVVAENGGVVFWKRGTRLELLKDRKEADRGLEYINRKYPVNKVVTDRWRETEVAIEEHGVDIGKVRSLIKQGGFNLYANSTGYGIHIMEPGVSKLKGLEVAASWLGVTLKEVLAIGDSEADIEFLDHCGKSGAPGNATPGVRARADFCASLQFGEGFVEVLRHFRVI
ncbi:MAG: phosphoglycolate phosphatase [Euryarchaeota archaeon]|nr:phosphoglycolate phosphatase [Euryarchaeota archaeon]